MDYSVTYMRPLLYGVPEEPNYLNPQDSHQNKPAAQQQPPPKTNTYQYFEASQRWLESAARELRNAHPSTIVPGISPRFLYRPSPKNDYYYTPQSLWNIRCLSPQERHELYIEFCVFGRIMRDNQPWSSEYISAFELVREKSNDVAQKERRWYAQFANAQDKTSEERIRRFKVIVVQQMHAVDVRGLPPASSASSSMQPTSFGNQAGANVRDAIAIDDDDDDKNIPSTSPTGQKRRASETEVQGNHRPAKRMTPEEESARKERAARAEAEHQRYLEQKQTIDRIYLDGERTRKPTDPEWRKLAAFDAHQAATSERLTKKPRRPSPKKDETTSQDEIPCPELPSRDLASYPLKGQGTYMCLHVDTGCRGTENCTSRNHECCRTGLSLRELDCAVKRKEERVCARIEELVFRDGKLNRRYKTWANWFSKEMRDRDSSRVKAHVAPLGWTYDSRTLEVESAP
jgi:hypothetical protein